MEKLGSEESEVTRPPPAPNLQLYTMAGKNSANDGEKALYTRGAIPQTKMEFTGTLEEANIVDALALTSGVILRNQISKRCFLLRKSYHDDVRDMVDVGGVTVSSKMILFPGSVSYLIHTNQDLKDSRHFGWGKVKYWLKDVSMKARHNNMAFMIIGINEKTCSQQYFPWELRNGDGSTRNGDGSTEETVDIIVYVCLIALAHSAYMPFLDVIIVYVCLITLANSAYMPFLDLGKPKCPSNLPLELYYLISLKLDTKAICSMQRALCVEKPWQKL